MARPRNFAFFVIRVYYETNSSHAPEFRCDLSVRLTRARVAISATFTLVGGGGGGQIESKMIGVLTQKLRGIERRGKTRSTALNKYIRKCFMHFFRSGQRSPKVNLAECHIIFSGNVPLSQNLS